MRRETKEVLAELVGKLKEKLDPKKLAATSAGEKHKRGELCPNLDRLTVGVDLGDQWSHYCILGLEGETLAEGQLRTTQEDLAEFFQALECSLRHRLRGGRGECLSLFRTDADLTFGLMIAWLGDANSLPNRCLPVSVRLNAKHAEAAVLVVKGDALDRAGDFLGRRSALWACGGHTWDSFCPGGRGMGDSLRARFRGLAPDG